jgi:hypothetical protein
MFPTPNPKRVIFRVEHMNPDRKTDCANYDGCLNLALGRGWEGGFSCSQCHAFEVASSALRRFK